MQARRPPAGAAVLATLLAAALAGCLGGASPPPGQAALATRAALEAAEVPQVLTWEGYIRANGGGEAPAHFKDTEGLVAPLWKSGWNLHVEELPRVLELSLDWTAATPSEVMMMAHVPWNEDNPRDWTEFEYPDHHMTAAWPSEGPICMRIPTDQVLTGHWHVMSHAKYGADIKLAFKVTMLGGKASVPDGLHGHPLDQEEAQQIGEVVKTSPWQPCELSA